MKKKRLPPRKGNKVLVIAIVSVIAIISLLTLFYSSEVVGRAFYTGNQNTAGIQEVIPAPNSDFSFLVKANIGKAKTVGVKFVLDLPQGLGCNDVKKVESKLEWYSVDGLVESTEECKNNQVLFDYLILNEAAGKTAEFTIAEVFIAGLPLGSFNFDFSEFKIFDLNDNKFVIDKKIDAIIDVGGLTTYSGDCGGDLECFVKGVKFCKPATLNLEETKQNPVKTLVSAFASLGLDLNNQTQVDEFNNIMLVIPDEIKFRTSGKVVEMKNSLCNIEITLLDGFFHYTPAQKTKLLSKDFTSENLTKIEDEMGKEFKKSLPSKTICNIKANDLFSFAHKIENDELITDQEGCVTILKQDKSLTCVDNDKTNLVIDDNSLLNNSEVISGDLAYSDSCVDENTIREYFCGVNCSQFLNLTGKLSGFCQEGNETSFGAIDLKCPDGKQCKVGKCVQIDLAAENKPVLFPKGASCLAASECVSGVCISGSCAAAASGASCTAGSECLSGVCASKVCAKGALGVACSANNQCLSNVCTANICSKAANGASCTTHSDCISNYCNSTSNKCETPPINLKAVDSTCNTDSECLSNYCAANKCATKVLPGAGCTTNSQCSSGVCNASKCTASLPPSFGSNVTNQTNQTLENKTIKPASEKKSSGSGYTPPGYSRRSCRKEWDCTYWTPCNNKKKQTRTCYPPSRCREKVKEESRDCKACLESWVCTSFSNSADQCGTRKCYDEHSCGTSVNKPGESKSCPYKKPVVQQPKAPAYQPPAYTPPATKTPVKSVPVYEKYKWEIVGGIASLALFGSLLGLLIYFFFFKKKVDYSQLQRWIKTERRHGKTDSEIRKILNTHSDWDSKDIKGAFKGL